MIDELARHYAALDRERDKFIRKVNDREEWTTVIGVCALTLIAILMIILVVAVLS